MTWKLLEGREKEMEVALCSQPDKTSKAKASSRPAHNCVQLSKNGVGAGSLKIRDPSAKASPAGMPGLSDWRGGGRGG